VNVQRVGLQQIAEITCMSNNIHCFKHCPSFIREKQTQKRIKIQAYYYMKETQKYSKTLLKYF
jgi:hypothetical protein